jgi:stage V sporulation protein B
LNINKTLKELKKNKFSNEVFLILSSSVILGISGLLLNILIGYYYIPEALGVFNQCFALIQVLSVICAFGITSSNLHFVSKYADNYKQRSIIQSSAISISFILSTFIFIVLYFIAKAFDSFFFNYEVNKALLNILYVLPIMVVNRINISYLNAIREIKLYSIVQSIRWIILLIIVVFFIFIKASIYILVSAFVFSELIMFIILIFCLKSKLHFTFFFNVYWIKKHLIFGSKTILVSAMRETNNKIDIFLISFFLTNYYVGIYSFASAFCSGILMLPSAISTNFNPIISKLWHDQKFEELQAKINTIKKHISKIMIVVFFLAAFLYPFIVKFVMNNPVYYNNIHIFYILLIGVSFLGSYNFMGAFLTMIGKPEIQLYHMFVVVSLNITLNIILINLFGLIGAAFSMSIVKILSILSLNFFIRWVSNIKIF